MIFHISTAITYKKNEIICSNTAKKHMKVYIRNVCEEEYLKTHYTVWISERRKPFGPTINSSLFCQESSTLKHEGNSFLRNFGIC